ncbi:MAG TPA: FG-GAP-like repeat-containing protein [Pyrinomonadaceae bacterium]|jgi:hypothetical protein
MTFARIRKALTGMFAVPVMAAFFIGVSVVSAASGEGNAAFKTIRTDESVISASEVMDGAQAAGATSTATSNAAAAAVQGCDGATFVATRSFDTGTDPFSVTTGDFNKDGNPDLATANRSADTVSVLLGTGRGSFHAKVDFATGTNPFSVTTGDFNKDSNPDLAVTNQTADTVSVLLGTGTGSFSPKVDFATGINPFSVTTDDFNKDGNLDLAVANRSAETVSVLLGTGTGSFNPKVDFATGAAPVSVTTGDFNKDGNPDLATANQSSSTVSVLLGMGTGSFNAKVDFATGTLPTSVTTGDFNKDGNLDLAVANNFSNTLSVLLGTGTGSFNPKVDLATGTAPVSVTTVDFNKDGNLDLAVANRNSNTVSVLLGMGTGSFNAKVDFATGTLPTSVTTEDFNEDGNLDLTVTNQGPSTVSVLLGTGAGSFNMKVDFETGISPFSVTTGDFNKDDNLDLAVANQASATVSVLLGNGAGSFNPKVDFATGAAPRSVVTGDFNKDSNSDLAVANQNSNTVSVLINSCLPAPANNAPVAVAPSPAPTTDEDTPVQITLTGRDADDNNLTFIITDAPDHGTLDSIQTPDCSAVGICTATVIYTPAANYNGTDSFKFKVNDGTADSAEATVNIIVNPVADLSVSDVSQAEGNAGQATFSFTVSLDSPAPAGGVTFDIATADGTATDADNDYEPRGVTGASIPAGQTTYMFDVLVNGDTVLEPNETFFVNIMNVTNATVADGQGTGTILNDDGAPAAGQIVISEFRLRGTAPTGTPVTGNDQGQLDEFIELYNTTDSDFVVMDSSQLPTLASPGWAIVSSDDPTTAKYTIPVGTTIPARGHYLVTNALGYSLSSYAAADVTPQQVGGGAASYNADIPDGAGLSLLRTGDPTLFATPAERLDAAGFTGSLFFEGMPLSPAGGINTPLQHSFIRRFVNGRPQDTQNNEADFDFVEVNGATSNGRTAILGAPGPENSESPIERNATVKASLIEPGTAAAAPPNRVRSGLGGLPNSFGTLSIQRRFKNMTGAPVTRLRFRVVDITTLNSPAASSPQADLRVISSSEVVTDSQGQELARVTGLTLEEPPAQANGGGLNSTLTVIPPGGALAVGATIDVQFLLSVQQEGAFRFFVNVEALTGPVDAPGATKTRGTKASRIGKKQ